jgi:hypothetical protein
MSRVRWRSFLPPAHRAQWNNSAAALAGIGLWLASLFRIFDQLASGALVPLLPDYLYP